MMHSVHIGQLLEIPQMTAAYLPVIFETSYIRSLSSRDTIPQGSTPPPQRADCSLCRVILYSSLAATDHLSL